MSIRFLPARGRNHSGNVEMFMNLWDRPLTEEQQVTLGKMSEVKQVKSEFGNVNNTGTPYPSTSCLLNRFHPEFENILEPGVRDFVYAIGIHHNLVTYTSCEGHQYSDPKQPNDERHVGIVARSSAEHKQVIAFFVKVAEQTNPLIAESCIEVAIMDHTVQDGDKIYPAIDLFLSLKQNHTWDQYFAAIDGASEKLVTSLMGEPPLI